MIPLLVPEISPCDGFCDGRAGEQEFDILVVGLAFEYNGCFERHNWRARDGCWCSWLLLTPIHWGEIY